MKNFFSSSTKKLLTLGDAITICNQSNFFQNIRKFLRPNVFEDNVTKISNYPYC